MINDFCYPDYPDCFNLVYKAYDDGECPDCYEKIPEDAKDSWTCPNCGHACYAAISED